MPVISSFLPFAPISWWSELVKTNELVLDNAEHFEKMSYRNRYFISGANNPITLSIPLVNGRDQRRPMSAVLIHNETKWRTQHWRTLVSVYRQTPYWEFYEQSLQRIYETPFTHLTDFNETTINWVISQLKLQLTITSKSVYEPLYPIDYKDLRKMKPTIALNFPKYYQIFEDRIGFQPNLSILDLLFSEGPQTKSWLANNVINAL